MLTHGELTLNLATLYFLWSIIPHALNQISRSQPFWTGLCILRLILANWWRQRIILDLTTAKILDDVVIPRQLQPKHKNSSHSLQLFTDVSKNDAAARLGTTSDRGTCFSKELRWRLSDRKHSGAEAEWGRRGWGGKPVQLHPSADTPEQGPPAVRGNIATTKWTVLILLKHIYNRGYNIS